MKEILDITYQLKFNFWLYKFKFTWPINIRNIGIFSFKVELGLNSVLTRKSGELKEGLFTTILLFRCMVGQGANSRCSN